MDELSTGRAVALYVGALLGPGLLLLPGLAAHVAGPASILAWGGLLILSGTFATVFAALGVRLPGGGGAATYAGAAFGPSVGRAVRACFVVGAVSGAPVVCLMAGEYVAAAVSAGTTVSVVVAAVLLTVVLATTLGGARLSANAQLVFVAVLLAVVAVAVGASAPHARATNWTPFAPHGWTAIGTAAASLMLCFVGWEAIAPLTARLREPARQLPRVIGVTFAITSVVFLGLGAATVAVLGGGTTTPIAGLLQVAVGRVGVVLATVAAVVLVLAAVNAYLTGAGAMIADARPDGSSRAVLLAAVPVSGLLVLGGQALGVPVARLVGLPTAMFVLVYVACTAAGVRILRGPARVVSALGLVLVVVTLAFTGWPAVVAVLVAAVAATGPTLRAALARFPSPGAAQDAESVDNAARYTLFRSLSAPPAACSVGRTSTLSSEECPWPAPSRTSSTDSSPMRRADARQTS